MRLGCSSPQTSIVINHIDNILLIEERLVWRPRQPIPSTSQIILMTLVKTLASYLQIIC